MKCIRLPLGLVFVMVVVFAAASAFAAPVRPVVSTLVQPDGTVFSAVTVGDEFGTMMRTTDGYTIVQDDAGAWTYAALDGGSLVATTALVGVDPVPAGIPPYLAPAKPSLAASMAASRAESYQDPRPLPINQDVLVLMVEYDDQPATTSDSDIESLFYGTTNSVGHWFTEMSGGKVTIHPAATYNPTNGITGWINLGPNHPNCEQYDSGPTWNDCVREIIRDGLLAIDTMVDFSDFDDNHDELIASTELAVIVMVAGYEGAYGTDASPAVWAHRYFLGTNLILDNVTLPASDTFGYAMFGEIHAGSTTDPNAHTATIGVIVHELGHLVMHWFDTYDTDQSSAGIGSFDIMANGTWCAAPLDDYSGTSPTHPVAFTKIWSGIYEALSTSDRTVTYGYGPSDSPRAVRVNTGNAEQYFLSEYRKPTGYDAGLNGCLHGTEAVDGLLITHIDESLITASDCLTYNNCNNDENNKLIDVEEADGTQEMDTSSSTRGEWADIWAIGATFDAFSTPSSDLDSGAASGVSIAVNMDGDNATFDLKAAADTAGSGTMQAGVSTSPVATAPDSGGSSASGGCSAGASGGVPLALIAGFILLALRRRRA